MAVRQQRHYGDGWPYSCRSPACLWCRRAILRGWWAGMRHWSEAAAISSLAIIPMLSPAGLPDAARRLRGSKGMPVTERHGARRDGIRSFFAGMVGSGETDDGKD
jgi:hypothetical protein